MQTGNVLRDSSVGYGQGWVALQASSMAGSAVQTIGDSANPSSSYQPAPFQRPMVQSLSTPGPTRQGPK